MQLSGRIPAAHRQGAAPSLLGAVRIVIGGMTLARLYEGYPLLQRLLDESTLKMPYLPAMPAPSAAVVQTLALVWLLGGIGFTIGLFTRTAGTLTVLALAGVLAVDQQAYSNHLYLLALLVGLLTCADAGAARSIDGRRRTPRRTTTELPTFLLKAQISIVYAFAGLAKITPAYLSGTVIAQTVSFASIERVVGYRAALILMIIASASSIAIELLLAIWLWQPSRRRLAVILGVVLHATMIATVSSSLRLELMIFAIEMLAIYPLFFGPGQTDCPVQGAAALAPSAGHDA